jgi:sugar lactone lactonase YvrE
MALAGPGLAPTGFRRSRGVCCPLALLFFVASQVPGLGGPASPDPFPVDITTQPRNITVPIGGTGVFSVVVFGGIYYQWRHNGQPIPGATSTTLTIVNVQLGDTGPYDIVITGNSTVTSTTAVLSIGQPIRFVVQPSDASVVVGSSAAFHVEVTGDGPFTYQWQSIPNTLSPPSNIVDGTAYRGTTTATLVSGPASLLSGSTQLTCEVSDAHGSPVSSPAVRLIASNPQCLTVTTLTGSGAASTGSSAQFGIPHGIAVDAADNLYVTDESDPIIRKITPNRTVTTIVGLAGSPGSVDGTGSAARFNGPTGIAVDAAGNLYVADTINHTIRKITPDRTVTTIAGLAGSPGSTDGTGSAARFNYPTGIAVDAAGNLYVADYANHTIRKITPDRTVTTIAGLAGSLGSADGAGTAARFYYPLGIAIDTIGNLYVADTDNNTIRKIAPGGVVTTFAGLAGTFGSADGTGTAARFDYPEGIAIDAAGNFYVADTWYSTIRKITPDGVVTTLAGQVGIDGDVDGAGSQAQFKSLWGIAVDPAGSVFVADTLNSRIGKGVPTTLDARMTSLSARGPAGSGDQTLIAGFATRGAGNKQLLLRGVGPGLTPFGVSGVVTDPSLTLFNTAGIVLQQNDNWGGTAALTNACAQVWAFPLPANSKDAALLVSLPGGPYTAHLTAQSGTGVALLEAYDTDTGTPTARLASLSTRDQVGTGDNILIAGFAITGNVSRTVLIRGIGPALSRYGVSGVLANPQLQVFQGSTLLAQNDDWGNDTTLATVAAQVNAFALDANSKDAALLLTLPPGAYTAQVSGMGNTTGVALVEVYEVP